MPILSEPLSNQGFYFFAHFEGDVGLYREKIEKIFVPYLTTGGYVGLSISVLLAQHEKVFAVDIVPSKVDMVNQRKSPIQDEYIEKYLAEKDLDLTASLPPFL